MELLHSRLALSTPAGTDKVSVRTQPSFEISDRWQSAPSFTAERFTAASNRVYTAGASSTAASTAVWGASSLESGSLLPPLIHAAHLIPFGVNRGFFQPLAATFLTLALGVLAFAGNERLAMELQPGKTKGDVDVIVQYKVPPTDRHHQRVNGLGGRLNNRLDQIRAGNYTVPGSALKDLSNDDDVAYITPNRPVKGLLDVTTAAVHSDVANLLQSLTGNDIGVAVIDSGISDSNYFRSFSSRVVFRQSFVRGGVNYDDYGHGTHVAGIIGSDGNGSVYKGVAPKVNLIDLRVLDANGSGTDAAVIAAINTAVSLKDRYNIRIINLSLGRPVYEAAAQDPLCQAVEAAWKAGIVVVAAAGNEGRNNTAHNQGYGTILSPGNDPYVITVGAMKTNGTSVRLDDTIASYSSKGPTLIDHFAKPDLVAPGNRIASVLTTNLSTLAKDFPANKVAGSNGLFWLSGTSMATPVVSGAVALMLEKNPRLTPDQVKARLMKTATKTFPVQSTAVDPATHTQYTNYYNPFTVGAGYLDVTAALADTSLSRGPALSPLASYDAATGKVILKDLTGNTVVWGDITMSGFTVVWSDTIVWADTIVWSDSTSSSQTTKVAITGEP